MGATNGDSAARRISIIVPTYQRREVVLASVRAMAALEAPFPFEVVVVVDGSTDGTAEALVREDLPFPLHVEVQPNRGRAAAVNRGAELARGDILLFLDDDMTADPGLLLAHEAAHRDADAVTGHLPMHPASPPSVLTPGVERWAERRRQKLVAPGAELEFDDLVTGHFSIKRVLFEELGGFDAAYNADGNFGGEDTDLVHRILGSGARIVFAADAVAHQRYVVTPAQYLRQWHQAGRSDARLVRAHPDLSAANRAARRADRLLTRRVWRPLARRPRLARPIRWGLRHVALPLVRSPTPPSWARELFFRVRDLEYWSGRAAAERELSAGGVRVLCYHAVQDLTGDAVLHDYGTPPEVLRRQLRDLARHGCTFIDVDGFLAYLDGAPVPDRAVLVTFDDAYAELLPDALPVLRDLGVPAVVFAVSGLVGDTNRWDQPLGARSLPLLDAKGLRALAAAGVEIGSHSRSHAMLPNVPDEQLHAEVRGSLDDLEALGLPRPRLFAYPHGEHDPRVGDAARAAGIRAAFRLDERVAVRGDDPWALPRLEIGRRHGGRRLLRKVLHDAD